ncbi:MAG TPA: LysR family transcriptional regulator [Paracoccaceae bacterium]|nr:LysR family transcriptional regulator [Paracoccaceae bacterium]
MNLSAADIRALTVFRAIVEHGGFTGAQLALGMSQSSISFHLRSLEERLGFSLCQRGRRGFALTERGVAVFEHSHALVMALSTFEGELGELRHRATGVLRVGIVDSTITDPALGIPDVIDGFLARASEVELRLSVASPEQLIAEMGKGSIEIAVAPKLAPLPGYRQIDFHHESHSLYCGWRHPLFARREVTMQDVEAHPFVVRPYANERELAHFPNAHVAAYASNMEAQAMYVLSGRMLGYLPDHVARVWGAGGRLRALLAPRTRIRSPFVVVTRGETQPSLPQRLFVQELLRRRQKADAIVELASAADPAG